ncbi:sensor histidine kinase [Nocardioides sp. SYSU D00038]|uniref:sensor histidine kinase n=1 Tax=Nocardioides sp. SYSU D00038 TaxID=2812554 RepID=UPI0019689D9E|nr:histidine kinase [Nocardioides sp. SYSU D00038]
MTDARPAATRSWEEWAPDAAVGAAVLLFGVAELLLSDRSTDVYGVGGPAGLPEVLLVLAFAAASGLSRRAPAAALTLVWVSCGLQVLNGTSVLTVQFSVAIVAFGCARWGRAPTVVLSGLSIPAAAVIGVVTVQQGSYGFFRGIVVFRELIDSAYRFSDTLLVGAAIVGTLTLALPWLLGLALRATARAQRSEVGQVRAEEQAAIAQRESEQAREIARLREEQARMARDVHDVVGHSLAVILAQAESAQYLDEPERLKETLATVATSARTSLQDVRAVLQATPHEQARRGGLDELIEGVRASGHEVLTAEVGQPQPLPPELEVVAYRVLQEMLTNAIRHGRRDRPVHVERHWPDGGFQDDLRIEVRNSTDPADVTQPISAPTEGGGQGLDGMRRRLESVGGRIDVRRREEPDATTFTATAWVPVRAGG